MHNDILSARDVEPTCRNAHDLRCIIVALYGITGPIPWSPLSRVVAVVGVVVDIDAQAARDSTASDIW